MLTTSSRFMMKSAAAFSYTSTPCQFLQKGPEPPPPTRFYFSSSTMGCLSVTDQVITAGARCGSAPESYRLHNRTTSELFLPLNSCLQWKCSNYWTLQNFRSFHSTSNGGLLLSPRTRRGQFVTAEDACNFVDSLSSYQRACLEKAMRDVKEEKEEEGGTHGEKKRERVEKTSPTWHQLRLCKS